MSPPRTASPPPSDSPPGVVTGPQVPEGLPLSLGDQGPTVGELRRRLALLDHRTEPDDRDHYGQGTATAVAAFQASRGLEPTGVCDRSTWEAVVESEHRLGDRLLCLRSPMLRGEDVADLQLRLGTLGFDSGRVDGIFGPHTQQAVGEFQRNAGIISDEVCGPDTVAALHRLAGRAGTSTLASVRERVGLQREGKDLGSLRLALGAVDPGELLVSGLAALLTPLCAEVAILEGDWSQQAQAANDFRADVYIGLQVADDDRIEAQYFAVTGFESFGGRSLAEAIVTELPATGLGVARGMRHPVLRETRAPAVLVRLGRGLGAVAQRDLVVNALSRALTSWRGSAEVSTST